jgi:hypothetical protein
MNRPGVREVRRVEGKPSNTLALTMSKENQNPEDQPGDTDADSSPPPPPRKETPFTDSDWRIRLDAWSGLFVRIGLVVGAVFSVYQYLAQREEQRVAQTMHLVELWDQGDYQQAQQSLKARLTGLNEKYSNLLGQNPSQKEQAVYRQRIGIQAMAAEGGSKPLDAFTADFDKIVYFLNRLAFCVDGGLCSRKMADAYFRDYATSFWSYFAGYIEKQRKAGAPTYALAIEKYVSEGPPSAPPAN